jgi:DNA-directed RNA polymerase subunit L
MVKISKHKIENINLFKHEKYEKYKKLVPELEKLLPQGIKQKIRFDITDANTDLANAIRRCILNELPVKSLSYDEYHDMDTSDPYILCDFLKKQIELIPIKQSFNYENMTISLNVENKSDENIDVKSSDFTLLKGNTSVKVSDVMSPLIVICSLRSTEYLYIKNIKIITKTGRESGTFCYVGNVYYKPLTEEKENSMITNPKNFTIGYSTFRNLDDPYEPAIKACQVLIARLHEVKKEMANVSNKDSYYYSDKIQVESKGPIKEVQIKNEQWTLVNLIARYIYMLTGSNIKFVTPSIIHYEKEIGVIRITHKEYSKLIQDSAGKAIQELESVMNQLKK